MASTDTISKAAGRNVTADEHSRLASAYATLMKVDSLARVLTEALGVEVEQVHHRFQVETIRDLVEDVSTALDECGFSSPRLISQEALSPPDLDDLPRLDDEEREALDSGLIAMEGVPVGDQPLASTEAKAVDRLVGILDDIEEQLMVRIGRGIDSLNEFIDGQKQESPSLLLIRDALADARNTCDRLFVQAANLPNSSKAANASNGKLTAIAAPVGLLDQLNGIRMEVEQARATAATVSDAFHHMNITGTHDAAEVLRSYVDNVLCEQVDKLDALIQDAQAVQS